MKAVQVILILCLLASMDCFNIGNFFTCILGKPAVMTVVLGLVSKIKEGEGIFGIISFILGQFTDTVKAVKECYDA